MSNLINLVRIKAVYNALDDLKDQVVFVGGATVALYADRDTSEVRPTNDVDVLIEISSHRNFVKLEEKLIEKGFQVDKDSKFVGRYIIRGLIVDIMPTDEVILGFANKWYADGFKQAIDFTIDEQHRIKIFSPPYFIASKIEAFKNRGQGDGRMSSDFEDIVFILENRNAIWEEMKNTEPKLKKYLHDEFLNLYKNPYILEWIGANLSHQLNSSYHITEQMNSFLNSILL